MMDGDLTTARTHFFKALGDPTRLLILNHLAQQGSADVTSLYRELGQAQNLISHHLACLRNCGLVTATKQGKQVYYRLRNKRILKLLALADVHIKAVLEDVLFCEVVAEDQRTKKLKTA